MQHKHFYSYFNNNYQIANCWEWSCLQDGYIGRMYVLSKYSVLSMLKYCGVCQMMNIPIISSLPDLLQGYLLRVLFNGILLVFFLRAAVNIQISITITNQYFFEELVSIRFGYHQSHFYFMSNQSTRSLTNIILCRPMFPISSSITVIYMN